MFRDYDLQQFNHFIDESSEVNDLIKSRTLIPGIDHQFATQFRAASCSSLNSSKFVLEPPPALVAIGFHKFDASKNPAEQVVEIVRDAAGKKAEALQFLLFKNEFLHPLHFCDVD